METDIGRSFMRLTRHKHLDPSEQQRGIPPPPPARRPDPALPRIELPPPAAAKADSRDFGELIKERTSVRRYSAEPLSLAELSFLLWSTQGVKEVLQGTTTLRTVPSAGARHAFETVVLATRVSGLDPGLYRYLALDHQLQIHDVGPRPAPRAVAACLGQEFVQTSAAAFVWVAVTRRMTWRYGQRGYRYLHLDAGHVCQNLYLAAGAIGAGACAIAAFDDDAFNTLLGLEPDKEFVIYLATVGKKRP